MAKTYNRQSDDKEKNTVARMSNVSLNKKGTPMQIKRMETSVNRTSIFIRCTKVNITKRGTL